MKPVLHEQIIYSDEFSLINSPAFYDCVVHLLCRQGNGSFVYNGNTFKLTVNDIAVVTVPRGITDISADDDFRCEYIVAPANYLHALLPANNYSIIGRVSLFSNPVIKADSRRAAIFWQDIKNIARRINDVEHKFYNEMMSGLVRTMMYDLFDMHIELNDNELVNDRAGYVTTRFFNMIQQGDAKIYRSPSYYASKINVSVKYLSDTIRRVTGESVSLHINRAAAAVLLEYLKNSSLSATQIAAEMNFASLHYFSRYCVRHLGMPPSRFRAINASSDNRSRYPVIGG